MVSDSSEEKGVEKKVDVKMIVRFAEEGGIGKMNPLKLTKELTGKCGDIKFARVLGDGNLLIGCSDELQVVLTKQLTMVGVNKVVKVVQVGMQREKRCKGVITGISLDIEEQEIKENLVAKGIEVISIKRMTRGPEKEMSESVLVELKGEVLPDRVFLGFLCFYVWAYIPKPMRCFQCQRFGHIAKICKEKRRCAKCSGDHEYGKCEGAKLKCCSCGGEHVVTFGGCEIMKGSCSSEGKSVGQSDLCRSSEGGKTEARC